MTREMTVHSRVHGRKLSAFIVMRKDILEEIMKN